jgi:hypothetical protein
VPARGEAGSVTMADAHGRFSGLGVALTSTGGLNLILLQRSGDGVADGYHFAHCSPFLSRTSGCFKESGLGREKGIQGLKAWMQQKSIYLATGNSVNAVDGLNLILLQRSGDGVADGYHFAHCSPFLSRTSGFSTPFGGFKESGLGREKGIQGLKAWMQQKSIYLAAST